MMLDAADLRADFQLVQIGSLVEAVRTATPASAVEEDEFTYVDLSAIDQAEKTIIGARKVPCAEAPSRARQVIRHSDVLVSTVRPNLNGVALVPEELDEAIGSTGFCVLRSKVERLHPRYLFHWVRTPRFIDDMVRQATGASYPAVTDQIVHRSRIPLPTLAEQRRIAAILDEADALRAKRRAALAQLDEMARAIFVEMFGDVVTNSMGWDASRVLGDVADVASGITKGRKPPAGLLRPVPYLAVANVQDRQLVLDKVKEIEASADEISRYRLRRDDLVLTEGGDPDKLGRGALWNEELPECIHQNHIFRVRLTSPEIHPVFLNWLVGSQRGKAYFLRSAKQTTGIASINMSQLRAFPLLVPPLSVQAAFVERLTSLRTMMDASENAAKTLDTLFASLQHRAFRGEL